jgi:hypothetical protein
MIERIAALLLLSSAFALPAFADPLVFDLGNANQPGDPTTASETVSNYVFQGGGEVVFSNSQDPGVTVGVSAYDTVACGNSMCLNSTYVTQKDTQFGGQETGVGESDQQGYPTDPDLEVTTGRYLVVNNSSAIASGFAQTNLLINSLDPGEGVYIYGVNSIGQGFNINQLNSSNLLATLIGCSAKGCTGGIAQYADLANSYEYFVITTIGANVDGYADDDFVLDSITFADQVAEPASIALLGFGMLGLLAMRRRAGQLGA